MKIERIVFSARGKVEIAEADLDQRLQSGEVLIRTACSMISAGTELAALNGTHSKSGLENPPEWLKYPSVPGYLVCGEVVDRGAGVTGFKAGDRVVGEGQGVWNSHCSYLLMDSSSHKLVPIHPDVTFEEGVFTKMGSIAMTGPRVLHPELGDSIAVMGLGVVGQLASRLSVLAGAGQVVGIDPLAGRREIAAGFKGVKAIPPDDPFLAAGIAQGGRLAGFDHVIEASGHPAAFHHACRITRLKGKIAILSSPHRTMEIRLYDHIHSRGLQILGAHGAVLPQTENVYARWTDGAQRRFFMQLMAEKRLDVLPIISHRVEYSEAPDIYRGLAENPGDYLGVLFYWNGYGTKRSKKRGGGKE